LGEELTVFLPLSAEAQSARARAQASAAGSPGTRALASAARNFALLASPTRAGASGASLAAAARARGAGETHEERTVRLRFAARSRQLWLEAAAGADGGGEAVRRVIKLEAIDLLAYALGRERAPERPTLVFTLLVGAQPFIFACSTPAQLARVFCGLQALSGRQVEFGELARARLRAGLDARAAAEPGVDRARLLARAVRRAARAPRAVYRAESISSHVAPLFDSPGRRSASMLSPRGSSVGARSPMGSPTALATPPRSLRFGFFGGGQPTPVLALAAPRTPDVSVAADAAAAREAAGAEAERLERARTPDPRGGGAQWAQAQSPSP
jgi:hypothetical protein